MLSLGANLRHASLTLAVAATFAVGSLALPATASAERVRTAPHDTMTPFASDRQLKKYLKQAARRKRESMPVPMPP